MKLKIVIFCLFVISEFSMIGNNLQISNIKIKNKDIEKSLVSVQFDIHWENSWRIGNEAANWDAAWVFIKFKIGSGEWQHATLSSNSSDHFAPSGAIISTVEDGVGIFIYRSANGSGVNDWPKVNLIWKYGQDGVSNSASDIQIKVFGIEMVYVPKGAFYAGDGTSYGRFRDKQLPKNIPAYISESPIVIRCKETGHDDSQIVGDGILLDGDGGIATNGTTVIDNPYFPIGYGAFYCMKYEISQDQYVGFLNTLTRKQQQARTIQDISGSVILNPFAFNDDGEKPQFRNSIRCSNISGGTESPVLFFSDLNNNNIGNEIDDGQNIALINFGWFDGVAYADWAGLRPMTELEYEKACRGPEYPVAGEFAWHTADLYSVEYVLNNAGLENEYPGNPGTSNLGNAAHQNTTGHETSIETPLRCGIFATQNSNRIQSGASYYGIMELTGNVNEGCVSLGLIQGRTYKGTNGDGKLTNINGFEGNATNLDWPGIVPGEEDHGVTVSLGTGSRGGDWNDNYLGVSYRALASWDPYGRNPGSGFRCVRSVK